MAAIQQQLINQLTDDQDIAALNFEAALQSDPAKAQQYKADRDSKKFTETLEIKRGNFQKAAIDMARYMDMDHHARYYDTRNTDLGAAQNNIIQIANANSSSLTFDMDNTKRQFLVNEWYAQNKLESLFFLQVAFLALVTSLIVIMLGKMNVVPWLLGKYLVFIIATAAAIMALYRFNYTRYTRDVRYWNKRKFGDNPGALKAEASCAAATDAISKGATDLGATVGANYTGGTLPSMPGMPPGTGASGP